MQFRQLHGTRSANILIAFDWDINMGVVLFCDTPFSVHLAVSTMMLFRKRAPAVVQDVFWSFGPLAAASVAVGLFPWPLYPEKYSLLHRWPAVANVLVLIGCITTLSIKGAPSNEDDDHWKTY